jgi:hypothetical protein
MAFSASARGAKALSVAHLGGAFGWLIHKMNPNRST